jgi:uncharacterized membrane protein YheB (UPF0754 family)
MNTQLILGPIIGAIIGYITNGIAIKMIFRPLYPKYVFGMQIPFTPGLISKERKHLAKTIGNTISENLMNREVLEKTLLSEDMYSKIKNAIDEFVANQSQNEQSLQDFLYGLLSENEINAILQNGKSDLVNLLQNKLSNAQLGNQISHIAVEHTVTKVRNGLLGKVGADKFLSLLAPFMKNLLAKHINEILANDSKQLVNDLLDQESDKLLSMKMCDIVKGKQSQINQFKVYVISIYKKLITDYLPQALETLNVSKIIESRIDDMDVKEVERLIFQVVDKELKAIVWLGALLGLLMGFINVII